MEKIDSVTELRNAILQLESKQAVELNKVKTQLHTVYESMEPVNLIKSTFHQVAGSKDLKDNILNSSLGFATGYLSKILFQGASHSPLRKLFGTALMFGVTNIVAKHPVEIKAAGLTLLNTIVNQIPRATSSSSRS
jgi:hypothetical protein